MTGSPRSLPVRFDPDLGNGLAEIVALHERDR